MTITLQPSDFEQGTTDTSGNPSASNSRIRTDYIEVHQNTISFAAMAYGTDTPLLQVCIVMYDINKNYIYETSWSNSGTGLPVPSGIDVRYIRVILRYNGNNPAINPSKLKFCELSFNWWQLDLSTADKDIHTDDAPSIPYALDAPYPDICWYLNNTGNDIINNNYRECEALGAFANATQLKRVEIPRSVKSIGAEAFRNTLLTSVTIASDCTYSSTSFPEGCVINFYPD